MDFLSSQAAVPDEKLAEWEPARQQEFNDLLETLVSPADDSSGTALDPVPIDVPIANVPEANLTAAPPEIADRYLRITTERLDPAHSWLSPARS